MPRRHLSKIHDFYYYTDGRSICQITDISGNVCEVTVKGRHAGNLEKHVYRNHEAVWNNYYHNYKLPSLAKEESFMCPVPKRPKLLPEYVKVTEAALDNINFTYRNLEKACITMATVDGRPISFVEDIGFRMILNPLLHIMNSTDKKDYPSFSMNKNRLQMLIQEEAESMRFDIMKKISGKMLSLKIDCGSILEKHFLCCNIFIRDDSDTFTYTLPLFEVQDITDSDAMRIATLEVLSLYGIETNQIYSLMVDSTFNIVSSTDLLKDEKIDELFIEETKDVINESNVNTVDIDDPEYDTFVIEVDYENESMNSITIDENPSQNNNDKSEELVNKVMESWSSYDMNCSVCPAHIFQLVIKEAQQDSSSVSLVKKIREMVKKYRSPENMRELYSHCKKTIPMDNPDRWISTYDMLNKLLELKPFLKKMSQPKELFISATLWKQISDYVSSYGPIRAALHRLQIENAPLSEFFKIWTSCLLKTKKIGTSLSDNLSQLMEKQQKVFDKDVLFLSCLFLDPRFKNIIDYEHVPTVIEHLSELYLRIANASKSSDDAKCEIDFIDVTDVKKESYSSTNSEDTDNRVQDKDVDDFIKSMMKIPSIEENPAQSKEKVKVLLKTFLESEPLLGVKEDVLKFWNEKKFAYPELYRISQCVFAVSATHYTINKLASQLKYLYNPYFTVSLGLPVVSDILMVRVNSDVAKFK